MTDYENTSNAQIETDINELSELEQLLYQLPDHLVVSTAGKTTATEYRMRATAALRAMTELLVEVRDHPIGVTRARLVAPLAKWREDRAKYIRTLRRVARFQD